MPLLHAAVCGVAGRVPAPWAVRGGACGRALMLADACMGGPVGEPVADPVGALVGRSVGESVGGLVGELAGGTASVIARGFVSVVLPALLVPVVPL